MCKKYSLVIVCAILSVCMLVVTSCNFAGVSTDRLTEIAKSNLDETTVVNSFEETYDAGWKTLLIDINDDLEAYPISAIFSTCSQILDYYSTTKKLDPTEVMISQTSGSLEYYCMYYESDKNIQLRIFPSGSNNIVGRYDQDSIALLNIASYTDLMALVDNPSSGNGSLDKNSDAYKFTVYQWIKTRYEYYDKLEGEYAGDKYTTTIFTEASELFGVSYEFVDNVWADTSLFKKLTHHICQAW